MSDKPKLPNIVDVIVRDFLDAAPVPTGTDPFSQGQVSERRRIRTLLTGMRFPEGRSNGSAPALGLEDIGSALISISKQEMSEAEFDDCVTYANRLMSRFAQRHINAGKVLSVCGMIILVAGEIQRERIAEVAQTSKQ